MSSHPRRCLPALLYLSLALSAFAAPPRSVPPPYPSLGSVERLDPSIDRLIAPGAVIEKLAEGFSWAEGPVWIPAQGHLLFSDVPNNTVYRWNAKDGLTPFLKPSGFTGTSRDGKEQGSNGLTLDSKGQLVLCQHGDRRLARLNPDRATFTTLADRYNGKRFNSPNDVCYDAQSRPYFTDPPYGLPPGSVRELDFHGLYRVEKDGAVTLLVSDLERPNGIAFSPDFKRLYVANSHRPRPIVMVYEIGTDDRLHNGRVLIDTSPYFDDKPGGGGLPDGLKADEQGNLWVTGPGGVLVVRADGKLLGRILPGHTTANCGWGDDGRTLYLTSNGVLARIRTLTKGAGW
ncbi:MAG: SMP-30/gluconolactonase/LRE family protein [Opitutaceae bacterium]